MAIERRENMRKNLKIILLVLVCLFLPNITVGEKSLDDIQEIGKQILKECNKVVIAVKVVLSQKFIMEGKESEKSESKMETQGIVLDSSGLTVISYSTIDFSKSIENFAKSTKYKMEIKSNIENVKLVLEDGKEIPAKIVLVDKDLDLAFIRPEKEEVEFNFIEVDKIKVPQVLDEVFVIYKLTRNLDRQLTIFTRQVGAIVKKPSTMYVLDDTYTLAGSFVFNRQKKLIGITVLKVDSLDTEGSGGMFASITAVFGAANKSALVVLPIEVIMDISKQAKKSKEK